MRIFLSSASKHVHSYYTGFSSFELLKKSQETTFEQYYRFIQKYEEHGHMINTSSETLRYRTTSCLHHHGVLMPDSTTTKFQVMFNGSAHISSGVLVNDIMHAGAILPVLKHLWCAHLDSVSSHNRDVRPQGASMHGCTYFHTARRGRRPSFFSLCVFSHSWALRGWHRRWRGLYKATHSHSSATDGF